MLSPKRRCWQHFHGSTVDLEHGEIGTSLLVSRRRHWLLSSESKTLLQIVQPRPTALEGVGTLFLSSPLLSIIFQVASQTSERSFLSSMSDVWNPSSMDIVRHFLECLCEVVVGFGRRLVFQLKDKSSCRGMMRRECKTKPGASRCCRGAASADRRRRYLGRFGFANETTICFDSILALFTTSSVLRPRACCATHGDDTCVVEGPTLVMKRSGSELP